MSLQIRFATSADADWCIAQDRLVPAEVVRQKIEAGEMLVAERKGTAIGHLRLEYLWSKFPFIALVRVDEECRNQGIGRALLRFLEGLLRERGHRVLLSSSMANDPAAQAWHRAVGFRECGFLAAINAGGVGEVFFSKTLS